MAEQQSNLTREDWLKQLSDKKHPVMMIVSHDDTAYAYPTFDIDSQRHEVCLGGHCSSGNYGWVK